jgi:lysozyme
MKLHPGLSRSGVELVKRFEGLRLRAGRLSDGRWTIGYGHTASAREGAEVTAEQAESLLLYDLNQIAWAIDGAVFAPINVNQFNALVSFAFNVGMENFLASDVLKRLNEGAYLQSAAAFELWRRADILGSVIVVDGLVRRRASEKALFLTPIEGFRAVPTPVVRPSFDPALTDLAPLLAGLASAVNVNAPLSGDDATAQTETEAAPAPQAQPEPEPAPEPEAEVQAEPEPDPVETSPALEAAQRVSERLNALFPDEPAPPEEAVAEPQPESAAPFELTPEPEAPPTPEAVVEAEPEPEEATPAPSLFSAPPPRVYEPTPRRSAPPAGRVEPEAVNDGEDTSSGAFGRRYMSLAERAAAAQPDPPPAPATQNLAVLALGMFGAVLFCGALATMVFGRATLMNLAFGLLGVVCMAPSALHLLTQLFGERRYEADED